MLLAVALPVFLVAGWPMLGYAVAAAAWLVQRGVQLLAQRRSAAAVAAGNRRGALAVMAVTTLGRVWLIALAVLLVGLSEREAGLAAALLCVVMFTLYFAGQGIAHLLESEETHG